MWHGHFQLPSLLSPRRLGGERRERKLPPCTENVLPLSIHSATHTHASSWLQSRQKKKKERVVLYRKRYMFMVWKVKVTLCYLYENIPWLLECFVNLLQAAYCLFRVPRCLGICWRFPLVRKLRVNKWSTSAPRHTCWVADLCFNVSFVWRLVFQHPQLE